MDDAGQRDIGIGDTAEVSAAAVNSTISMDNLVTCVEHVRNLLEDIKALQKALAAASPGDDHSEQ